MSTEVRQMFSSIATRYDVTNEVLSFGIHRLWRRSAVRLSGAREGNAVLDCATGTGDLALAFKRKVGASGRVMGTDFCKEMLDNAPAKAAREGLQVEFQVADAMALPFADASFDVASIAFGIRNVDDPVKCLKEMARVVRPGGRVVVLEFGQPTGLFGGAVPPLQQGDHARHRRPAHRQPGRLRVPPPDLGRFPSRREVPLPDGSIRRL